MFNIIFVALLGISDDLVSKLGPWKISKVLNISSNILKIAIDGLANQFICESRYFDHIASLTHPIYSLISSKSFDELKFDELTFIEFQKLLEMNEPILVKMLTNFIVFEQNSDHMNYFDSTRNEFRAPYLEIYLKSVRDEYESSLTKSRNAENLQGNLVQLRYALSIKVIPSNEE